MFGGCVLCVLGCHRCSVGLVQWFSAQCWSIMSGDLSIVLVVVVRTGLCLGLVSCVAALYVIVARCPTYGARWFSLIALLPAPVGRISSCADLLVA